MRALTIMDWIHLYKALPPGFLLVAAFLFLTHQSICQEKKSYPDGTTGLVLEVGPDDYLTKKRPPNEFEGTYSTFRLGLGYILDGAAYSQTPVFKQQMDSAGLVFDNKFQSRDARILASGVFNSWAADDTNSACRF